MQESERLGMTGEADERTPSIALAESCLRVGLLSPYVPVNVDTPSIYLSPPIVLRGRQGDLWAVARRIDDGWDQSEDWHPHVWLSKIQRLLPAGVRGSDPLLAVSPICRRVWNSWRKR